MESLLIIFKFMSLAVAGVSGVISAIFETKGPDGKLNKVGKALLGLTIAASCLGILLQSIETVDDDQKSKSAQNAEHQKQEKQAQEFSTFMEEFRRSENRLEQLSAYIEISLPVDDKEIQKQFPRLTNLRHEGIERSVLIDIAKSYNAYKAPKVKPMPKPLPIENYILSLRFQEIIMQKIMPNQGSPLTWYGTQKEHEYLQYVTGGDLELLSDDFLKQSPIENRATPDEYFDEDTKSIVIRYPETKLTIQRKNDKIMSLLDFPNTRGILVMSPIIPPDHDIWTIESIAYLLKRGSINVILHHADGRESRFPVKMLIGNDDDYRYDQMKFYADSSTYDNDEIAVFELGNNVEWK